MSDRIAEIRVRSSRDLAALTCAPVPSAEEQRRVVDVAYLLDALDAARAEIASLTTDLDEVRDRYVEETTAYQEACDRYRAENERLRETGSAFAHDLSRWHDECADARDMARCWKALAKRYAAVIGTTGTLRDVLRRARNLERRARKDGAK